MNRIERLFKNKNQNILSIYCTAGFPHLHSTLQVMKALQNNGADMIELGMPYSDPLADGAVIQASNNKAIKSGMTISKLFQQLQNFRKEIHLPVILMGYINPVLQYGFEKFCEDAAHISLDGLIIPDLPEYEFEKNYAAIIKKYGLNFIFLITPETSDERIKKLDELSTGFLYAVSSSSITGKEKDFSEVEKYLERLNSLHLKNKLLAGFGIKDKSSFQKVCAHAAGAIVGTAYIQALKNATEVEYVTKIFLNSLLNKPW